MPIGDGIWYIYNKNTTKSLHILWDMLYIHVKCSTIEGTGFRYLHSRFLLVFTKCCYKCHTIFVDNGTYKMAFLWYCQLLSQMPHRFFFRKWHIKDGRKCFIVLVSVIQLRPSTRFCFVFLCLYYQSLSYWGDLFCHVTQDCFTVKRCGAILAIRPNAKFVFCCSIVLKICIEF